MKILYHQKFEKSVDSAISRMGFENCYLKFLPSATDKRLITKKVHRHRGVEIHFITRGRQRYETDGKIFGVNEGEFLYIPPQKPHRLVESDSSCEKFAITFIFPSAPPKAVKGKQGERIKQNLFFSLGEKMPLLLENCVLETAVAILRAAGLPDGFTPAESEDDAVLDIAKQYIKDNVESPPTVGEVAGYCSLSVRQLTRNFKRLYGISPGEYIIGQRVKRIEKLLVGGNLTLRQISERMGFANEYYFNTFFKERVGMPPGEYRRMNGK